MIPGARLILLGRQGAGKGTQCVRLSRHFVVPHISTGDMLRAAVREGTELGVMAKQVMDQGNLVGDEIMVGIVESLNLQVQSAADGPSAIQALEIRYFNIMCYGTFPLVLETTLACFYSGRGRTTTIMVANVFFHIIPGQKRMVADIRAGREPDPTPGIIGKQRSVHNNYFTLPVLFTMIAGHFAFTYGAGHAWLVLLVIGIIIARRNADIQMVSLDFAFWPVYLVVPIAAGDSAMTTPASRNACTVASISSIRAPFSVTSPPVIAAAQA
mgnify:CR=1 FL=1